MRDYNGSFGFSISGGKGADPYIEGDEAVYISKVVEHGPAHRDFWWDEGKHNFLMDQRNFLMYQKNFLMDQKKLFNGPKKLFSFFY